MAAPDTTLAAIQKKVRRITRSPSVNLLSENDLNEYINTFLVYGFPEHLRTFNFRTNYSFFTNPNQDVYPTDTLSFGGAVNNVLFDFQNNFTTVHPPFYISGYPVSFVQSQAELYGAFPKTNTVQETISTGNGITTNFSGTLSTGLISNTTTSLLQREVLFNSIDIAGIGVSLTDIPVVDITDGSNFPQGNLYDPNGADYKTSLRTAPIAVEIFNRIDYTTGAYNITFSNAPAIGQPIYAQYSLAKTSRPLMVGYYANKFIVRPVPDKVYRVEFEVYANPTWLMNTTDSPDLKEYWQYIAYGASRKIFEDRMDYDSIQMITPGFTEQQNLCERRTLVQLSNNKVPTIYDMPRGSFSNFGNNGFGL